MDKLGQTLGNGGAVILPTETVYGLFAKALDEAAVDAVYALKQRPRDKAMNLNVASIEDIYGYSKEQPLYLGTLVENFLPGPLTIILKANDRVPYWVNSGMETVGFRMPAHSETLRYIASYGPLIGPSANISGQESGQVFKDIVEAFDHQVFGLADDPALTGLDSTILDLTGPRAKILRQGAITKADLLQAVPQLIFD